jgi:hypothetical protein
MVFSIGDIITLVVVLLILVIYRALDRNNRSLEKLKRFSDKITENLSAFVDEKTTQVKDLSLELQGNLKMGKEILTRARGVEEALQSRAGDVEAIQKRFAEYDTALSELTAMSARVDKNLLRIRDEAEFVDTVGRRIEESAARLEKVENRIPELEKSFAATAREALSAAGAEAVAAATEKVGQLASALNEAEKKVKDHSTYLARLAASEEQTEKARLATLAKTLDTFDVDLRGRLSAAARKGESLEDEVFARLQSRMQSDEAAVTKGMEAIESRLSDYQGDVDYRVKALEEANADVDSLRGSLGQTMERMAAEVRMEMKAMGAELVAGWSSEIANATQAREQLRAGMADVESGLAELKNKAYQSVEKKLSVFEDEFFADLRARSVGIQEKFQTWQGEMDKRLGDFEADVKERISSADQSVQALRESLRGDLEKAKKDVGVALDKDLTVVRDAMDASTRKMNREIETGLKDLAAELEAGRKELSELFDSSRAEISAWEERSKQ